MYRMLTSSDILDKVIFSRSSPGMNPTPLPEVARDVTAIENLIGSDPLKTHKETVYETAMQSKPGFSKKLAYLEKIQSFLCECKEMSGGVCYSNNTTRCIMH